VVVDLRRPDHAHDTVMDGDERDGEQVRDPVLKEREEGEHDEEMEMRLDIAA
jgi:hypothetical protein